jgi:hypothetical protein
MQGPALGGPLQASLVAQVLVQAGGLAHLCLCLQELEALLLLLGWGLGVEAAGYSRTPCCDSVGRALGVGPQQVQQEQQQGW